MLFNMHTEKKLNYEVSNCLQLCLMMPVDLSLYAQLRNAPKPKLSSISSKACMHP